MSKQTGFDAVMEAMQAAADSPRKVLEARRESVRALEAEADAMRELAASRGWQLVDQALRTMLDATHVTMETVGDPNQILKLSGQARAIRTVLAHPQARIDVARIERDSWEKDAAELQKEFQEPNPGQ